MSVREIGVDALTLLNHEEVLIVMPVKRRRFAGLEDHFPDFDAFVFEQQLGCHVAKFVINRTFPRLRVIDHVSYPTSSATKSIPGATALADLSERHPRS